jgi:hypothetical protein
LEGHGRCRRSTSCPPYPAPCTHTRRHPPRTGTHVEAQQPHHPALRRHEGRAALRSHLTARTGADWRPERCRSRLGDDCGTVPPSPAARHEEHAPGPTVPVPRPPGTRLRRSGGPQRTRGLVVRAPAESVERVRRDRRPTRSTRLLTRAVPPCRRAPVSSIRREPVTCARDRLLRELAHWKPFGLPWPGRNRSVSVKSSGVHDDDTSTGGPCDGRVLRYRQGNRARAGRSGFRRGRHGPGHPTCHAAGRCDVPRPRRGQRQVGHRRGSAGHRPVRADRRPGQQ